MARLVFTLIWLLLSGAVWASQEQARGDHVTIRWLAPEQFGFHDDEIIGLYFEVEPGWHVYWRNPGDSGAAPRFNVTATHAHTGEVLWPFPVRLPVAHLTNLGYPGNVAYLFTVKPAPEATQINLAVDLEWLVCKVDCIPGFGSMTLQRPVADSVRWDPANQSLRDDFLARIPRPAHECPWTITAFVVEGGETASLFLEGRAPFNKLPKVFPVDGAFLSAAEPAVQRTGNVIQYQFRQLPGSTVPAMTDMVVTDGAHAWQYERLPVVTSTAAPMVQQPPEQTQPLAWLVLLALAGGVILNLMPCVFPVLSIKVMALVKSPPRHRVREALSYTLGVLVTFTALGGLLLVLRSTGAAVGWGFQLQSPGVVLSLIALFWLMALSFWGWLAFGQRIMALAGSHQGGSFATGVLAVFVATPCTGPFMGVALGAAVLLPAAQALLVFVGLGLGLALPFVLLSMSPGLLQRLPKPGPWMVWLQQLLAFPLAATVLWLLWVLARQTGESGWVVGLLLVLSLSFAVWLARWLVGRRKLIAVLFAVLAFASAWQGITGREVSIKPLASEWQPYDAELVANARAAGRAVFIDFTAAWCITCQVNKKRVLDTEPVLSQFAEHNVLLIRADWTQQNPAITQALAALGRNSVPVYAWYPSGAKQATLLPQLLQPAMIETLFSPSDDG